MLNESPDEAEKYLSSTGLTFETIGFAGHVLAELSASDSSIIKSRLIRMIQKTNGQSSKNVNFVRLGSSAINLFFVAWHEMPEMKWESLILDNAYLPGADFSGINLSGTSLRDANLDNADFTQANLTGCDLTGVRFEETNDICAMKAINDDNKLYLFVLYSDGKIRKWDIFTNQQTEMLSSPVASFTGMGMPFFGLVFVDRDKLLFTNSKKEGLEIQGGVHCGNNCTMFDIQNDSVLFSHRNMLSRFDLMSQSYIFENYLISENTKAIIVDGATVCLYNNTEIKLLTVSGDAIYEKCFTMDLKDITTISAMIDENSKHYLICVGYKDGKLSLLKVDNDAIEIASYHCGKVKSVCFLDSSQLVYTGIDGVIHVLDLNAQTELTERTQWKLAVRCLEAIIDGVKQREQYEKLKEYQNAGMEQNSFIHVTSDQ